MIVVTPRKLPGSVEVSPLVDHPHGQVAQQTARGIRLRTDPATATDAGEQRVGAELLAPRLLMLPSGSRAMMIGRGSGAVGHTA